jgi:hypothetical protein
LWITTTTHKKLTPQKTTMLSSSSLLRSRAVAVVARSHNKVGGRNCLRRLFGADAGGHGGGVPVPQSQHAKLWAGHAEHEGWESTVAWFYPTSIILCAVVLYYEPETSIHIWAKQEAAARLKLTAETGFTDFMFGVHYQDLQGEQLKDIWDKFSTKAIRMTDDDDDEEEEEEEEEEDDE